MKETSILRNIDPEGKAEQTTAMTKESCWLKWFLPGALLVVLAFWAGTLPQPIFALAGFLSFFTVGVTLIIEGRNKRSQATSHKDT